MSLMIFAILSPFICALFIPILRKRFSKIHIGWLVLFIPLILFIYYIQFIPQVSSGSTFQYTLSWIPTFQIEWTVYIDGLSLLFGLLITGMGVLVTLYSIYYLDQTEALHRFYMYLLFFMGAMLGVVFTDHMIMLYIFWELTSIQSFLLIAFWYERKNSRYGALKSMLITVFGGLAMLVGFLIVYQLTGSFSIRENISLIQDVPKEGLFYTALVLILLGAFTKSAQFPFHIWLPDAMEAPTPVSAYLHSATMVKAGIYLVARFTSVFGGEGTWFWLVAGTGLITLLWGAFTAIRQVDLKALLAYSTISQLGLMMTLLGIGSLVLTGNGSEYETLFVGALFAGLFHLVNHATFKGALFMIVGIIDLELGTRNVGRLGGLARFMPITFTIAAIGSLSMAGLPPFNGFLSKEMFFEAVLHVRNFDLFSLQAFGNIFPIIAWIASVFTFTYCLLLLVQTFFGKYQPNRLDRQAKEAPIGILIAPGILGLSAILLFIFPNVLGTYILIPAMTAILPMLNTETLQVSVSAWHGFTPELWMTLLVIVMGTVLYATRNYWKGIYDLFPTNWSIDSLYSRIILFIEHNSTRSTKLYMRDSGQVYIGYIYMFFVLAVGGVMLWTGAFDIKNWSNVPIAPYEWILTSVMVVAAIAILFSKSRVTVIILNGALGFSIALFFVLFKAPDLALTQLVIETITTTLFLLSFYFLPELKPERLPNWKKTIKVLISVSVGTLFVVVALIVNGTEQIKSISYFFEDAEQLMGGQNIVNAILGDFRAFDTMLEVIVLVIAGLGVFTLVQLRKEKEE